MGNSRGRGHCFTSRIRRVPSCCLYFTVRFVPPRICFAPSGVSSGSIRRFDFPSCFCSSGGQFVGWDHCSTYVAAHERLFGRLGWQALCSSIELLALDPLQLLPESGMCLGDMIRFLCCIPTKAEFESYAVPFSLCALFRVRGEPRSGIRAPSMPHWLPWPTECRCALGCGM